MTRIDLLFCYRIIPPNGIAVMNPAQIDGN